MEMDMKGSFQNEADAMEFILSGKAIFTIVSKRTGTRFTYKVERPKKVSKAADAGFRYVKVLVGPDNYANYKYIGTISKGMFRFANPGKQTISEEAPGVVAINWAVNSMAQGRTVLDRMEIWHEGRCGACAHRLTVPESIAKGFGPECAKTRYVCE